MQQNEDVLLVRRCLCSTLAIKHRRVKLLYGLSKVASHQPDGITAHSSTGHLLRLWFYLSMSTLVRIDSKDQLCSRSDVMKSLRLVVSSIRRAALDTLHLSSATLCWAESTCGPFHATRYKWTTSAHCLPNHSWNFQSRSSRGSLRPWEGRCLLVPTSQHKPHLDFSSLPFDICFDHHFEWTVNQKVEHVITLRWFTNPISKESTCCELNLELHTKIFLLLYANQVIFMIIVHLEPIASVNSQSLSPFPSLLCEYIYH